MVGVVDGISIGIASRVTASVADNSIVPEREAKVDEVVAGGISCVFITRYHIQVHS